MSSLVLPYASNPGPITQLHQLVNVTDQYVCVFMCVSLGGGAKMVYPGLAELPRQVLGKRRVLVLKLFCKSVLKYVFSAQGWPSM